LADVPSPWRVTRVRLSEAARLAGVSRSSLDKAIKKRRLSCETDQNGQQWIDASDIARAYPGTFRSMPRTVLRQTALERELRERLADKDAVIADLRRRLDAEAEERRQLLVMLSEIQRLLKDHMQAAASAQLSQDHDAEVERRTPWWRRWWRSMREDAGQSPA
jgi:hypothetical protein